METLGPLNFMLALKPLCTLIQRSLVVEVIT